MRFIAFAVGILFLSMGWAVAATYIVDQGGAGDYETIQAAVAVAADGDSILVRAGLYEENVIFPPPAAAVHLIGEDPSSTIIDAGGVGKCILIEDWTMGEGVIEGFTLRNSGTGYTGSYLNCGIVIYTAGIGSWTVRGNIFRSHPNASLLTFDATLVDRNVFVDGGSWAAVFVSQSAWPTITNNDFLSCPRAIQAHPDAYTLTALRNVIYECAIGFKIGTGVGCVLGCNDLWEVGQPYVGCDPGEGDFAADPLFCGVWQDDFTLHANSPCVPGNHPQGEDCGLVGAFSVGCASTPVQSLSWGALKALYRD